MNICEVNGLECCECQPVCEFRKDASVKDLVTASGKLIEKSNNLLKIQKECIKKQEYIFDMNQDLLKRCADMVEYLAKEYSLNKSENKAVDELLMEINSQLGI